MASRQGAGLLNQKEMGLPHGISLVDAHTDLLNHIQDFAAYDRVVLIDAILDADSKLGRPAGLWCFRKRNSWPGPKNPQAYTRCRPCWRSSYSGNCSRVPKPFHLGSLIVNQLTHDPLYATQDRIDKPQPRFAVFLA